MSAQNLFSTAYLNHQLLPKFNSIRRLDPNIARPKLNCGDSDLDEFFSKDSIESDKQLLSVTYLVLGEKDEKLAFLSLSNDSIKKEILPRSTFQRITRPLPRQKRYSSMPAVKLGRLATKKEFQGLGIGTDILYFLKFWFTNGNKTGCKFILVDAYNNDNTINFYKKNGFDFLIAKEDKEQHTRLMYFDLITFRK